MNDDPLGPKRSALQIAIGAGVVLLGLAALVVALGLTLDHYPVQAPTGNQAGTDRSSAVVAVLTPIAAGIAAIVGLYFGISATGSSRAQTAKANAQVAQSTSETAKALAETAKSTADTMRGTTS
jgi:uncharacterized membrane protein YcjF (UPF0283 family)